MNRDVTPQPNGDFTVAQAYSKEAICQPNYPGGHHLLRAKREKLTQQIVHDNIEHFVGFQITQSNNS